MYKLYFYVSVDFVFITLLAALQTKEHSLMSELFLDGENSYSCLLT